MGEWIVRLGILAVIMGLLYWLDVQAHEIEDLKTIISHGQQSYVIPIPSGEI